jgi:hypothetical protein
MFLVKTIALLAIPMVLASILWALAIPSADFINEDLARLFGLTLLGIALVATIFVFRSAVKSDAGSQLPRPPTISPGNEFRRGFIADRASPHRRRAPQPGELIALRRRRIEPRIVSNKPGAAAPIVVPGAPETIAALKQRLQDRAAKLWSRQAS